MSGDQTGWVRGERINGQVVRIVTDRGFAFIRSGQNEYFMHCSALEDGEFLNLTVGELLTFIPVSTPKGPRAEEVLRQSPR